MKKYISLLCVVAACGLMFGCVVTPKARVVPQTSVLQTAAALEREFPAAIWRTEQGYVVVVQGMRDGRLGTYQTLDLARWARHQYFLDWAATLTRIEPKTQVRVE